MSELCSCCSGLNASECCLPYLNGEQLAPTPLALMRSRYSAYVHHDVDYLIATWATECRAEEWRQNIIESFKNTEWCGLHIVTTAEGKNADEGFVEFIARFIETEQTQETIMHERSRFLRQDGRWFYKEGITPQVGRNDPCPCGSGKKYKKCCSQ